MYIRTKFAFNVSIRYIHIARLVIGIVDENQEYYPWEWKHKLYVKPFLCKSYICKWRKADFKPLILCITNVHIISFSAVGHIISVFVNNSEIEPVVEGMPFYLYFTLPSSECRAILAVSVDMS